MDINGHGPSCATPHIDSIPELAVCKSSGVFVKMSLVDTSLRYCSCSPPFWFLKQPIYSVNLHSHLVFYLQDETPFWEMEANYDPGFPVGSVLFPKALTTH